MHAADDVFVPRVFDHWQNYANAESVQHWQVGEKVAAARTSFPVGLLRFQSIGILRRMAIASNDELVLKIRV